MENQFYSEDKVTLKIDRNSFTSKEINDLSQFFKLSNHTTNNFLKKTGDCWAINLNNLQTRFMPTETSLAWLIQNKIKAKATSSISLTALKTINDELIKHPFFTRFENHIIIIHPKGKSYTHYHRLSRKKIYQEKLGLKDFNAAFNHIKKSRNKLFDSSVKNLKPLKIVGNFLAKEVQTNDFAAIFISTNNYLIPAAEDEFADFYHSWNDILPTIAFGVRSFLAEDRQKIEQLALEFFDNTNSQDNFVSSSEAIHQEKMRLLGELLNTLKHELSNPIFGLKLACENLLDIDHNSEFKEYLEQINQCVDNSQSVLNNFSSLYQEGETITVALNDLIKRILTLTKSATRNIRIETHQTKTQDILINLNPTYLIQPIFNLILNSAQALKKTEKPIIQIKTDLDQSKGLIFLNIIDNGPGIPQSIHEKLFSPFVTTKENGTGLGLAISRSLLSRLKGHLDFDFDYKGGARFTITIPLLGEQ